MRGRLGRRAAAAAAAAGLLLGGLAGCSDGGIQVEATAAFLAESAERTTEADTGRFEGTVVQTFVPPEEVEGDDLVVTAEVSGVYDVAADRSDSDVDYVIEGAPPTYPFATEGTSEELLDGLDLYLRGFPFTGEGSISGLEEQWVLVELPEEVIEAARSGAGDTSSDGYTVSPAEMLDLLTEQIDDIEEVGAEEVRGVETTRLHGVYPLPDELLDLLEENVVGRFDAIDQDVDVWVDDEGLVRRISTEVEIAAVTTEQTVEYLDFGTEVDIAVPDDATPLDELEAAVPEVPPELDTDEGREAFGLPPVGEDEYVDRIVEGLSQLSLSELDEDPCQAFADDPQMQADCELAFG